MPVVSIVGTSGRKQPLDRLLFYKMCNEAERLIESRYGPSCWDTITLVSGGAAWSDHVAVKLFLKKQATSHVALKLYIPCAFEDRSYHDTGVKDWRTNPGKTANYYHRKFSTVMEEDTMSEIALARERGAVLDTSSHGFHSRNTQIARACQFMIAFAFSDDDVPKSGGTQDTWDKCMADKHLVCLPL